MLDLLEIAVVFTLGLTTGAAMFVGFGYYQLNKIKKNKADIVDKFKKHAETVRKKEISIKDRFVQAHELAKMQVELKAMAEMPSKNALHSRHKNGLISEIAELERQKISILKTILGDGMDPLITVINPSGEREEILLSTYVAGAETTLQDSFGDPAPSDVPGTTTLPKKIGKFVVLKGGKDDGTTH
jgi:hypothetical protein